MYIQLRQTRTQRTSSQVNELLFGYMLQLANNLNKLKTVDKLTCKEVISNADGGYRFVSVQKQNLIMNGRAVSDIYVYGSTGHCAQLLTNRTPV